MSNVTDNSFQLASSNDSFKSGFHQLIDEFDASHQTLSAKWS